MGKMNNIKTLLGNLGNIDGINLPVRYLRCLVLLVVASSDLAATETSSGNYVPSREHCRSDNKDQHAFRQEVCDKIRELMETAERLQNSQRSMRLDKNGNLMMDSPDGEEVFLGNLRGERGKRGPQGAPGKKGEKGPVGILGDSAEGVSILCQDTVCHLKKGISLIVNRLIIGKRNNACRYGDATLSVDANGSNCPEGRGSVTFGTKNKASGKHSSVLGGEENTASGAAASVLGGRNNTAGGSAAVVGGGSENIANGYSSSIVGGERNIIGDKDSPNASGSRSSILGGRHGMVTGEFSILTGEGD